MPPPPPRNPSHTPTGEVTDADLADTELRAAQQFKMDVQGVDDRKTTNDSDSDDSDNDAGPVPLPQNLTDGTAAAAANHSNYGGHLLPGEGEVSERSVDVHMVCFGPSLNNHLAQKDAPGRARHRV